MLVGIAFSWRFLMESPDLKNNEDIGSDVEFTYVAGVIGFQICYVFYFIFRF